MSKPEAIEPQQPTILVPPASRQRGGARPGAGQPRRAGNQPIERVEIKFGESELAEIEVARGGLSRSGFIREAALREARKARP